MPEEFVVRTEPFRRELIAHCYRLLGSAQDAEDVVQETYLRAWRAYGQFQERSSVRTWLYRIATNACLNARRARRWLPSGLSGPSGSDGPGGDPQQTDGTVAWLEPIPDALVAPESDDPAVVVAARAGLRLALIAGLQHLPGRQRAVLILRDVLAWPAVEVAQVLELSPAAVKSALQRARARLRAVAPDADEIAEPTEPQRRAVLQRYLDAFTNADMAALADLLRADAILEATPLRGWSDGRDGCLAVLAGVVGSPGDWRMVPTAANGQPAAVAHRRDVDGIHRPFGTVVLGVTATHVTRIVVFGDAGLATRWPVGEVSAVNR